MAICSSIVFLTIGFLLFHQATAQLPGGWQVTTDESLKSEMVALAQIQLTTAYGDKSPSIEVTKLERQVVAGTNLRLQFSYGKKYQCEMTAFKPLPYTKKPTQVIHCACHENQKTNDYSESNCSSEEKKEKDEQKKCNLDSEE